MNDFKLVIGAPVAAAAEPEPSAPGKYSWGRFQFPSIERLPDGTLHAAYHIEADSSTAYGRPSGHALSRDGGQSWQNWPQGNGSSPAAVLKNGLRLRSVVAPAVPLSEVSLPESPDDEIVFWTDKTSFYLDSRFSPAFNAFPLDVCGADGVWRRREIEVTLPDNAVRYVQLGIMPRNQSDSPIIVGPGGKVYLVSYLFYLRDYEVNGAGRTVFEPTFLVSADGGERFDYLSRIRYAPDPSCDPSYAVRDGFAEPGVGFSPSGDMLCLMRTQDSHGNGPMYISRSRDGGKNWEKPEYFDDLGVLPQLLTLKCGVTLASYGRPGIYLRATDDADARVWQNRVEVLPPSEPSCCYTGMVADGDASALLISSDFLYPGPDGQTHKTILVRRVTVE